MLAFLGFSSKETKGSNNSSSQPSSSSSHVGLSSSSSFAIAKTPEQYFLSEVVKRLLMDDPRRINRSIHLDTHQLMHEPIAALDTFIKKSKQPPRTRADSSHKEEIEALEMQHLEGTIEMLETMVSLTGIIGDGSAIADTARLTSEISQLDQKLQGYKAATAISEHRLVDIEKVVAAKEHRYLALDELYNVLYNLSRSTTLAYQDIVSVLGPYAASTLIKVMNDLSGLHMFLQRLSADKRQAFLMAIKIHLTSIISSSDALLDLFKDLSPALRLEILPIFDDVFRNTRLTYLSACDLLILLPPDSWGSVLGPLSTTMSAANIHRIRVWAPIMTQIKNDDIDSKDRVSYFKRSLDGRISAEDFFIMFGRAFLVRKEEAIVELSSLAHELFGASFMTMAESAITKGRSIVDKALEGTHHLPDSNVVLRVINFYLDPPLLHRVSSWRRDESIALATEIRRFLSTTQQGASFEYSEYLQYKLENADINAFGTFSGLIHALQARLASGPTQALILSSSSSSSSRASVPSSSNSWRL